MGEKGNVTSDELATAAAAGGIGAHAADLAGVVRDNVVGRSVDAVLDRKKDDPEDEQGGDPGTHRGV